MTPRRAVATIAATVVVTAVLATFASRSQFEDDISVDNDASAALEAIEQRFSDPTSVLQVVVESTDGGDVRTSDALVASLGLQRAIASSPVADTLIEGSSQPPIVGFLAGAELLVEERDLDPSSLTDAEVRDLQAEGQERLPEEAAAQLDQLTADADPPPVGLLLVFQDTGGIGEDERLDQQRQLADVVDGVAVPDGVDVSPLAFPLLLEDDGGIGAEVGRLFATALAIILALLAVIYWIRPGPGTRARILRRTAADVGLTLLVIVFAVVWMQGLGVLLGPDHLGLIGYFNNQTQIVPILIVGLGVDFTIHFTARYRSETGASGRPTTGYRRAFRTVGLALLLDTSATAIGFLTNLVSPVEFLATLGVLAALGIVAAFVLTITFYPAVRLLLDGRARRTGRLPVDELARADESALPTLLGRTAVLAERVPVVVVVVAAVLTAIGGYGFTQLDSRFAVTDFVPQDEPQLETFRTLEEHFGGGLDETTEVLLTGPVATPDAHGALRDALANATEVDGVRTVAGDVDATSVLSVLGQALSDEDLARRLAEQGLEPDLSVPPEADVEALYRTVLDEVPRGASVLAVDDDRWSQRVELRTAVDQQDADRLRRDLVEAFAPLTQEGIEVAPTSQAIVQSGVSEAIEEAQLRSIAIALGAVLVLLAAYFGWRERRPAVGVLTLVPMLFVLALTFGMMALTRIPLNPVTATLAALSIGIGVPFNIHVSVRYLEERTEPGPGTPLRRAVARTGGAVVASALTTGIGFGVLMSSTLLPFEQLGAVIVFAIAWSAIAATVVLPSLLALWERRQHDAPPTGATPHERPRSAGVEG